MAIVHTEFHCAEKYCAVTEIRILEPSHPRYNDEDYRKVGGRVMNTLTATSKIDGWKRDALNTIKLRETCARDQIRGWVDQGYKHDCTFTIIHKQFDQVV